RAVAPLIFPFERCRDRPGRHSFPTRRSSDLVTWRRCALGIFDRVERRLERTVNSVFARAFKAEVQPVELASAIRKAMDDRAVTPDRKSTRLNSSHVKISYAVFCLKKKKRQIN